MGELDKEQSLRSIAATNQKGQSDNLQTMLSDKVERISILESSLSTVSEEMDEVKEQHEKELMKIRTDLESQLREEYALKLKEKDEELDRIKGENKKYLKENYNLRLDSDGMQERLTWLIDESGRLRKELDETTARISEEKYQIRKEMKEKAEKDKIAAVAKAIAEAEEEMKRTYTPPSKPVESKGIQTDRAEIIQQGTQTDSPPEKIYESISIQTDSIPDKPVESTGTQTSETLMAT